MTTMSTATATSPALGAVTGTPRRWLRLEGLAVLVAGAGIYLAAGGPWLLLVPLLLAVDVSMAGYLASPRAGALVYNLAHNQATGLLVLGAGVVSGVSPLVLAGAVLVGHTGMDRLAGYGLKYGTAFGDTHLGRIGR
jgi:hypothetical protein